MPNFGILTYCRSRSDILSVQRMAAHCSYPISYVVVDANSNVNHQDVARIAPKFPKWTAEPHETLWQLPHITPYDVTLYIDASRCVNVTDDLFESFTANPTNHVCVEALSTVDKAFEDSLLPAVSGTVVMFDKTETSFNFFNAIRDIGRNWDDFAIARLHQSHRKKRIDILTAIAADVTLSDTIIAIRNTTPMPVSFLPSEILCSGATVRAAELAVGALLS